MKKMSYLLLLGAVIATPLGVAAKEINSNTGNTQSTDITLTINSEYYVVIPESISFFGGTETSTTVEANVTRLSHDATLKVSVSSANERAGQWYLKDEFQNEIKYSADAGEDFLSVTADDGTGSETINFYIDDDLSNIETAGTYSDLLTFTASID